MFKNYLKIAWRNLVKDKFYVGINILGLSVGIGVCLIISLYIQGELSYDNFHSKKDRIYRLTEDRSRNDEMTTISRSAYSLAEQMETDIPEIEAIATVLGTGFPGTFKKDEDLFNGIKTITSDSDFFKIFDFNLLLGDKNTLLDNPQTVAISKSTALKMFGEIDVLGEQISQNRSRSEPQFYTITGVFEDVPSNSHMEFDIVTSLETQLNSRLSLDNSQFFNYALLIPEHNIPDLKQKTQETVLAHFGKERVDYYNQSINYQPLEDVYLSELYAPKTGDAKYIRIFSIIAFLILGIAMINYTNLSIARSAERSKEVGVRKVVGASRSLLIKQFLGESILYSIISVPIALLILDFFLPYFNALLNSEIVWKLSENLPLLFTVVSLLIIIGIISSLYPALVLSSYKPVNVLTGSRSNKSAKGAFFRKGLITIQFAITSLLIASTLIIINQLGFIKDKKLGFDEELLLSVNLDTPNNRPSSEVVKSTFLNDNHVKYASRSFGTPGLRFATLSAPIERLDSTKKSIQMNQVRIDDQFVETMDLKILAGDKFQNIVDLKNYNGAIINKTGAIQLGWENPEMAIGNEVQNHYGKTKIIIAVVEDFHFKAIHHKIDPLIMVTDSDTFPFYSTLNIRLSSGNIEEAVRSLEETWASVVPGLPFDYEFVDNAVQKLYQDERNISSLFKFFAMISIIISCIGLIGLSSYTAQKRSKEIGIRKVLGATVSNIISLLSYDFVKLVAIGLVPGSLLAWYFMSNWLENFAYRIELGIGVFVLTALATVFIALLAVSSQSFKTAVMNPTQSLKSE
jgi:putative ABC transport system permease protein